MSEETLEKIEQVIEQVKEKLRGETIKDMARFDVKDGAEGSEAYHKIYLDAAQALCGQKVWDDLSPWEKLCCYKISGSAGVDCDASLRSTVIYQLAFGYGGTPKDYEEKGNYHLKSGGFTLRGDTMNSYATTVRGYIRGIWLPTHKSEMLNKEIIEKDTGGGASWAVAEKYRNVGGDNRWDAAILGDYDYFKDILSDAAQEFFRLYHTVGNFLPTPWGFNNNRGGCPSRDYWDLALMCIYNDRCKVSDPKYEKYTLEWLIKKEEAVSSCRAWLDSLGSGQDGWDCFVERNFLQDFVNQDGEHYGPPKELWKGHFTGSVKPRSEADFEQFFTNVSVWIAARGLRIALAIKKALSVNGPEEAEGEVRQ